MTHLNRRNLIVGAVAGAAALPSLAVTKIAASPAADPIFAAIDKHRNLIKECDRLWDAVEGAENKAKKKYGHRPWSLIAWRNYSAIGGSEIDDRREEFLQQPGADPKKIEKEYRAAKAQNRAAIRAGEEWDKRTGVAPIREQYERARGAETAAGMRMAKTTPKTSAGSGALIAYTRTDLEIGMGPEWHLVALATAADALEMRSGRCNPCRSSVRSY